MAGRGSVPDVPLPPEPVTLRRLRITLAASSAVLETLIDAREELDDDEVAATIRYELELAPTWHRFNNIVVHPKAVAAVEVESV